MPTSTKRFMTEVSVGGEKRYWLTDVKPTKRQIRQEKSKLRNGTHELFDGYGPPPLRPAMHRMKGAKAAYARRPKNWDELFAMFPNEEDEDCAGDENYAIEA